MRETTKGSQLGGAEDFNEDGHCYTGERFLSSLDENLKILGWLALVRAMTLGQAARYGWRGDHERARLVLEALIWRNRWIGKVGPIALPKGCGAAARKSATIYYLTERGAQALARCAPRLARQARPGRPKGATLSRLPHELLVAEAWLWTAKRREILEFWPETELKSQIVRSRMRALRDATEEKPQTLGYIPDEATGDFKMRVLDNETGGVWWVEAEVAVRYRADQIVKKPHGMDWFVCDRRQAQLVELIKGIKPFMLGDVTLPLGSEPVSTVVSEAAHFRTRVLRALDLMDGAATASCLQRVLGGWRSHVSQALSSLEADGILWHEEASIRPGKEKGRPSKLYVRHNLTLTSAHEIVRRACASQMAVDAKHENYMVEKYDAGKGHLFLKSEVDAASFVCVIDDGRITVSEYYKLLKDAETLAAKLKGGRVLAVMSEPERVAELKGRYDYQAIWDLLLRVRRQAGKERPLAIAEQRKLALA